MTIKKQKRKYNKVKFPEGILYNVILIYGATVQQLGTDQRVFLLAISSYNKYY